ncbi:hypothetical protein ACOSQ3_032130 [Xanthoceras sorbifolium]
MINPKKLIKIARKWQRVTAPRKKRISIPRVNTSPVADKGHFVVYTNDQRRFLLQAVVRKNPNKSIKKVYGPEGVQL